MFKNHPSIIKIGFAKDNFSFILVSDENVLRAINSNDISALVLRYDINRCIDTGKFPSNATATYIRDARLLIKNYKPVSKLPRFLQVYEKNLHQ